MGRLEIVKTLWKSGFPVSNDFLFTGSVQGGNIEIRKALIDARNAKGRSISYLGSTALKNAAAKGDLEMIDILLAVKAWVCYRNEVIPTALDAAIDIRNITILKRLLKSAYEVDMGHQNCPAAYKARSGLRAYNLAIRQKKYEQS